MKKLKLVKNVKALSNLSIIILLIASLILGALLSYLWVMGYYLTLGIQIPKKPALSISDVVFDKQDTGYFNVTFFNPSYSSDAILKRIAIKTEDDRLLNVTITYPIESPYTISKAENKTFECMWNWAGYTGQKIGVIAFVDEGSGPTYETATPFVDLTITGALFNSSRSVTYFNLTMQNSQNSVTYVNISQILVPTGPLEPTQVSPSFGTQLNPGDKKTFNCTWDWTNYLNKSIAISVYTVQGYFADHNVTYSMTKPLNVEITNVVFSESNMTKFDLTVRNRNESATSVDINRIILTLDGIQKEINKTAPSLPQKLYPSNTTTFECLWNWTNYRGKDVEIIMLTVQNYNISYTKATPSPIEITEAIFNAANTSRFNITIRNSALYYASVNITNITLTFENGTVIREINGTTEVSPQLPNVLNQSSSRLFECLWDWTGYQGSNIIISVRTANNYIAQFLKVTPKRVILTITSISFDPISTSTFSVTVRNSNLSVESARITNVTVTLENGTSIQVSSVSPSLPYSLGINSTVTFACQLDWTSYRGKNITITIYAEKGYVVSSLYTTPPIQ